MNETSPSSNGWVIAGMVLGHAIPWTLLVLGLLVIVPRYDRVFRDFNMKLPRHTEHVLEVSRLVVSLGPLLPLALALLLALDTAVLYALRSRPETRAWSWFWFVLLLLLLLAGIAVCAWGVGLAQLKLLEGLSR